MDELLEQYNELVKAINSGALRVKYSDKEVTYRSLSEMYAVKAQLEKQLGYNNQKKRRVTPIIDKGL